MPTISVSRKDLFDQLGRSYTDEEFDELCFGFGLELDEITTEQEEEIKEKGFASADASNDVMYKIEIAANRYDLLCIEGLVKSIKLYLGVETMAPEYSISKALPAQRSINVYPSVQGVRPHVICGIIRGIEFTQKSFASFIALQDKLHQNLCRVRSLVSMGTHDLATVKGQICYSALPPKDIRFKALNVNEEMTAAELYDRYNSTDSHLKPYLSIIKPFDCWPVIYDDEGVLSWPPITNSERTKITVATKDVFIEITATDKHKAEIVLDILTTTFGCYTKPQQYQIELVNVIQVNADGKPTGGVEETYPRWRHQEMGLKLGDVNGIIGRSKENALDANEVGKLLMRMGLQYVKESETTLRVRIPPNRADILHVCDLLEDCAIAFGYNNVERVQPPTLCFGAKQPLNHLTDLLRSELAQAGYTEALTFALCRRDELTTMMMRKEENEPMAVIANPKTIDFQVCRTSLVPGLLKTLSANKRLPLPLKLFEISDVVLLEDGVDTDKGDSVIGTGVGAINRRHVAAVYSGITPGFEKIHGLLDRLLVCLNIKPANRMRLVSPTTSDALPQYFDGRRASVVVDDVIVGHVGVLHPNVLNNFSLKAPSSAFEIDLELLQ